MIDISIILNTLIGILLSLMTLTIILFIGFKKYGEKMIEKKKKDMNPFSEFEKGMGSVLSGTGKEGKE